MAGMNRSDRGSDFHGPNGEVRTAVALNVVSGASETSLRFACLESGVSGEHQGAMFEGPRPQEQRCIQIEIHQGVLHNDARAAAYSFEDDLKRVLALHA